MPDEPIENVVQPELCGGEPSTLTAPAPAQNSLAEKINGVASRVSAKFGIEFKPGRGRPKKDGSPKKSDIPLPADSAPVAEAPAPSAAFSRSPDDSNFIKKCFRAAFRGLFSALDKIVGGKAKDAGYAQPDIEKVVRENSVTSEELDGFAELGLLLADYYKLDTKTVAAGGAVVLVGGVGGRYWMTISELAKQAAARAKAGKGGAQ